MNGHDISEKVQEEITIRRNDGTIIKVDRTEIRNPDDLYDFTVGLKESRTRKEYHREEFPYSH